MIVTPEVVVLLEKQLKEAKRELDDLLDPIFDAEQRLPGLRQEVESLSREWTRNTRRRAELESLVIVLEASLEDKG